MPEFKCGEPIPGKPNEHPRPGPQNCGDPVPGSGWRPQSIDTYDVCGRPAPQIFYSGATLVSGEDAQFCVLTEFSEYSLPASSLIATPPTNGVAPFTYEVSVASQGGSANGPWSTAAQNWVIGQQGTTQVWVRITDANGDFNVVTGTISVADCRNPQVTCFGGLVFDRNGATYPTNIGTIAEANDLFPSLPLEVKFSDGTPFGNWGDIVEIPYLQWASAGGTGSPSNPLAIDVIVTADPGPGEVGFKAIAVAVRDAAGNWDYCETFIDIQDGGAP